MGIAFFDMDLTLTRAITNIFLADAIGRGADVQQLEEDWQRLGFSEAEYKRRFAAIIEGTTLDQIESMFPFLPLIDGIADTVQELAGIGVSSEIVTVGTGYFAELLVRKYGFDRCAGSDFTLDGRTVIGFEPNYITIEGKGDYVRRRCEQEGIDPATCYAIGDSFSDRYMFRAVGTSIAINHSEGLEDEVTHAIKPCRDLREILPLVLDRN